MRLFFILIILVRNSEPQLQNYVRTPQPLTPAPPPNQTFIPIRPAPSFAQQLTPPSEQQLTPAQFFTPPTLPPPLGQPLNEFIQQPPNRQCYLRKCDQIISGRNLLYARALEIVQNEDYLSEAELDLIRRFKRQTMDTFMATNTDFSDFSTLFEVLDAYIALIPEAIRDQLCALFSELFRNFDFYSTLRTQVDSACDNYNVCTSTSTTCISAAVCTTTTTTIPCSDDLVVPNFLTGGTVNLRNNAQCKSYLYNLFSFIYTYIYARICLLDGLLDFLTEAAPIVGLGAGTVAVAGIYASPSLPMTLASGVPPGNPPPGTPGGGAPPSAVAGTGVVQVASAQTLSTALALVPLGLTAVAVFPPYNRPRTIPAISVIFAEDPGMVPGVRKKRSLQKLRRKVYKFFLSSRKKLDHWIFDADLFLHEVKYFLTRELSVEYIKEKTRGKIYYLKEKLGELKKNFMCLKSRLRMYAWQQKKKKYNHYNHYGKREIINR